MTDARSLVIIGPSMFISTGKRPMPFGSPALGLEGCVIPGLVGP